MSADVAPAKQYADFYSAMRDAYKFRESGDWTEAENAMNQGLKLTNDKRRRSEIHRQLMTIYSKTDRPTLLFPSTEYVAKHHPHPASVSITISSLLTTVRRLEWHQELKDRYEAALRDDSEDRIALMIMEGYQYVVTS